MTPVIYTLDEVAGILKVSARHMRALAARGAIRTVQVGARRRVRLEDLESYLAGPQASPDQPEPTARQRRLAASALAQGIDLDAGWVRK